MTNEKKPDDGPDTQAMTPAEGQRPDIGAENAAEEIAGAEPVPVDPAAGPHSDPATDFESEPQSGPVDDAEIVEPPADTVENIAGSEHPDSDPEAGDLHRDPAEDSHAAGEAELAAGLDADTELTERDASVADDYPEPEPAPAPLPDYDDHPPEDEPAYEEQGRSSLAARALQGLVILLVGAAIALWALPRVTPMLPASVAEALAPASAVTPEDLAALEADFDARIAELEAAAPAAPDMGPVTARLEDFGARLEALEGAGPAAGAGGSDMAEANQSAISSLRAELEQISATLAELGSLPPEAAQTLASASQRAASLSEKVDSLTSRLDAAEARFDERATAAEAAALAAQEEAEAAEKRATLAAGFRAIGQALDEGRAFAEPLREIAAYAEPPEALATAAAGGVPTLSSLRERFTDAGRRAMEAQGLAEAGDGFFDRAAASLKARVSGVPVDAMEGDGLEARLGRAAAALRDGDLGAALDALDGIPTPAEEAMAVWLADARARHAAGSAAAAWRTELGG